MGNSFFKKKCFNGYFSLRFPLRPAEYKKGKDIQDQKGKKVILHPKIRGKFYFSFSCRLLPGLTKSIQFIAI